MNEKKLVLIGIVLFVILISIITITIINNKSNNSLHTQTIKIDNYNLVVKGNPVENKLNDSIFTTSFKIESKETHIFYVDYLGLSYIDSNKVESENADIIYGSERATVTINGKKFWYTFDSSHTCGQDAILTYEIPNNDQLLKIRIRGGEMYYNGMQAKCLSRTTMKTLKSRQLKKVLDFKIN